MPEGNEVKLKKMQAILERFLGEISEIRSERNGQIKSLLASIEKSNIQNVLNEIKNIKK